MRQTRNPVVVLAAASALVLVVGCSSGSTPTPAASTAAAPPTPAASTAASPSPSPKQYSIDLIVGVTNSPFYTSMEKGAMAMAAQLGVKLTIDGALVWDPSKQIPILDAVIARHPDGIIFVADDPTAENAALKTALDAGIVVATADSDVSDPSLRIVFYNGDNQAGGLAAGQAMASLIGGKGKVFELNATPGVIDGTQRMDGFKQGLGQALTSGAINFLPVQYSNEDQVRGTAVVSAVLAANPDLAGIFAEDTINGQATAVAVKNAHLNGKVKVVAYDASPGEVDALKAGTFSALIAQKPYDEGGGALQSIVDYLNGNKAKYTGQTVSLGVVVMTQQNITDPNVSKYMYPLNLGQ